MNFRKITLSTLTVFVLFSSCKKDDDDSVSEFIPADRTEQQVIDGDSLLGYLQTHYYNSSTFESPGNHRVTDIVIKELPRDENGNYEPMPDPDDNTLLIDSDNLMVYETTYLDVVYEYYILKLNQGGGQVPHFSDDVRVNYSGMLQNDVIFDSTANPNPTSFDLLALIQGWRLVMPKFNTAESFENNGDGTFNYDNFGLGVMFLPSGLAYFGSPPVGVTLYSNLIFKFELLQTEINDHELSSNSVPSPDSVPSYLEDLDGDENLFNDDTDGDGIPNFIDVDDDNDGVLTKDEVETSTYTINTNIGETEPPLAVNEFVRNRVDDEGIITLKTVILVDSNSNGIPDYLESSIAINLND